MIRLVSRATLLSALAVMAATYALAGVPNSTNSTQPAGIALVGTNGSVADPTSFGAATYTIRDAANNPVANSVVVMNFTTCTDVRVCSVLQPAGETINCPAKTVSAVTNASGVVTFRIVGGGLTSGAAVTTPCVSVTADGVPLTTVRAATFDMNGSSGVTSADLTLTKFDFNTAPTRTRSDFNKSGSVTTADLTLIKNVFNAGGSTASCGTYCP
jgi:hypothetical protein